MDLLRKLKICFRCCGVKKHLQRKCTETIKCDVCKSKDHPSALHQTNTSIRPSNDLPSVLPSQSQNAGNHGGEDSKLLSCCTQICGVKGGAGKSCAKIMPAFVYQEDKPELAKQVYVVIDDQSNRSLATPALLDKFNEDAGYVNFLLSTCSGKIPTVGRVTKTYTVEALDHILSIRIPSLIECSNIPNNKHEIPSPEVARCYPHLKDVARFIPPVDLDMGIEVLLGRDVLQAHYVLDQRFGGPDVPYAQRLPLGWVIIGETCLGKVHNLDTVDVRKTNILASGRNTSCFTQCENRISVKSEPIFQKTPLDETPGPSIEDGMFLDLMDSEMTLDQDGHWTAPLPFRKVRQMLPSNRKQALQRVKSLDSSLQHDPVKKEHLMEFMRKKIEKGHAEIAPPLTLNLEHWYLPFFGIYHPKKPGSIRVVFDSSAKFNGLCLNSVMMTGPDLTNSLLGVLLRFRKEAIAITADVEQMFYNFRVKKSHRIFLRFIWHADNDLSAPLVDYQMTVHVFGNSRSPSIATFALRRSVSQADQDVQDFVCRNFYVDDGLTSCTDTETAVDLMRRTQKALKDGGKLRLHKIVSNSKAVLQSFDSVDLAKDLKDLDLSSDSPPIQRSLGLSWDISTDDFIFKISPEPKPFTRRGILSTINSIFVPLGIAAPVTLCGKLLLREITSCSGPVNWDEELPETTLRRWKDWVTSLKSLEDLRIPRKFSELSFVNASRKEVHVFCDASKEAIASVAYIKLIKDDRIDVSFLMGKAKVAPEQGHTIPRLELCAAVLSVQIADIVKKELDIDSHQFYFYTDSKVVLGYLSNETRRFYVYVTNRVSRIRASSSPHQWYFVSTEENPADIASRGTNAVNLLDSTYLCGPSFLLQNTSVEIKQFPLVTPESDKEVRPEIQTAKTGIIHTGNSWTERFSRFSTWNSLVRAISLIKAAIRRRQNKDRPTRSEVEQDIIRIIQHKIFPDIVELKANKECPRRSDLLSLSPFLDSKEILRVGGRLKYAKDLSLCLQPVILPKKHHISTLLVRHYHAINHYQGRHMTEGALRSAGFWIIGSKRLVPAIVRQCIQCKRLRGSLCVQKMADLPEDRLNPSPPFTFVGIDTFGPWPVVIRKTRGGSASHKRWAILFTCLVSRAIHIEVIEELSSSSFINAFRRFVAIRGPVKLLRSDRGTNFVGSVEELGIQAEFIENGPVDKALSQLDTVWKFNPPHASHFGGTWERMIGVCRRILDNMLFQEKNKLTHEVLCTLMAEVSAIVNSRPLTSVSADSENPDILSPSRLLTQKIPQHDIDFPKFGLKDMLKSQWKLVQGLADEFWKRWSRDYIHNLQVRRKWKLPSENLNPGNVVVLRDKDVHRIHWPLAVVDRVFKSEDGIVRKAEVTIVRQGKRQTYVRPVTELVHLF